MYITYYGTIKFQLHDYSYVEQKKLKFNIIYNYKIYSSDIRSHFQQKKMLLVYMVLVVITIYNSILHYLLIINNSTPK